MNEELRTIYHNLVVSTENAAHKVNHILEALATIKGSAALSTGDAHWVQLSRGRK